MVLWRKRHAPYILGVQKFRADGPMIAIARGPHYAELVQAQAASANDANGYDVAGSHIAQRLETTTFLAHVHGVGFVAEGCSRVVDASHDHRVTNRDALARAAIRAHLLR